MTGKSSSSSPEALPANARAESRLRALEPLRSRAGDKSSGDIMSISAEVDLFGGLIYMATSLVAHRCRPAA